MDDSNKLNHYQFEQVRLNKKNVAGGQHKGIVIPKGVSVQHYRTIMLKDKQHRNKKNVC